MRVTNKVDKAARSRELAEKIRMKKEAVKMFEEYVNMRECTIGIDKELKESDAKAFNEGWDLKLGGFNCKLAYMSEVYEMLTDCMVISLASDRRFIESEEKDEELDATVRTYKLINRNNEIVVVHIRDYNVEEIKYDIWYSKPYQGNVEYKEETFDWFEQCIIRQLLQFEY